MVTNLRKNFLCVVWHQKPTVNCSDKGWTLGIVLPKKPEQPTTYSANLSKSAKTFWNILEKKPYWVSVVRVCKAVRFLDLLIWS